MALPTLSPEQRAEALKKAAYARSLRTDIKNRIGSGDLNVVDLINDTGAASEFTGDARTVLTKTKVLDLVKAMRGVGTVKANHILERCDIATTRRLGGLGDRQRRVLSEEIAAM